MGWLSSKTPLFALSVLVMVPVVSSANAQPGLTAAPQWQVGDWWAVELRGPRIEAPVEARLVVAEKRQGDYFVGVQEGHSYLELLAYHFPFFGRVSGQDLSYSVRDQLFQPLQFPLETGRTWTTTFADQPLRAHVVSANHSQARIDYTDRGVVLIRATYDAAAGTITSWYHEGYGGLQVKDWGRGFACAVHYASKNELLFLDHARGSMVLNQPRSRDVGHDYERAVVVISADAGRSGLSSSLVLPPDGQARRVSVYPHDVERYQAAVFETRRPQGTWRVQTMASDHAFAVAAAVGFDLRRVHLGERDDPDSRSSGGCVVPGTGNLHPVYFSGAATNDWTRILLWLGGGLAALALWLALRRTTDRVAPLWFLFAKIPKERVLESRIRSDIRDLLRQRPGLTTQEIRRTLRIGWGNTVHHLAILKRAGLVVDTAWGRNRHWFLQSETRTGGRVAISALRRDAARNVFNAIRHSPGISQEDLAKLLSIHHSTVFFHVERLVQANLVRKARDGTRVRYFAEDSPSD